MMDIVTKANVTEKVYFMKRNQIESAEVHEINIKVYHTGDEEKIIISYKMKFNTGVIDTDWYLEDAVFMTDDALVKDLLLKTRIEGHE